MIFFNSINDIPIIPPIANDKSDIRTVSLNPRNNPTNRHISVSPQPTQCVNKIIAAVTYPPNSPPYINIVILRFKKHPYIKNPTPAKMPEMVVLKFTSVVSKSIIPITIKKHIKTAYFTSKKLKPYFIKYCK